MTADMGMVASGPLCTTNSNPEYEALILFAWLMVLVWVLGMPLGLLALLYSKRRAIESRTTRKGGNDLKTISFLFRLFKPRCKGGATAHETATDH